MRILKFARLNKVLGFCWTVPAGGMSTLNTELVCWRVHECCSGAEQSDNCQPRKDIATFSVRDLLCHKAWLSLLFVSLDVLQPLGSHLRERPNLSQPHNIKHIVVLHVLELP